MQQHERSSIFAIRVLVLLTLTLGRAAGRVLLYPVCAYFMLFTPAARRASREYLGRVLAREPRLAEVFRHIYTFASVSLDRVFMLKGRFKRFEIHVHGADVLHSLHSGQGHLMIGGHLGSFEALRAMGREKPVCVNLLMYEDNARNVITVCKAIDPELAQRIIPLGRLDSMLRVADCLERGECEGVLADRALDGDGRMPVKFLGQDALFPVAPFRMAAMLKYEVVFMVGLYRGGNRYDLYFERLIGVPELARADRRAALAEWVQSYAGRLEHYCRLAPYNWFNFFDFWDGQSEAA
ncbi:MAG: acyl-CoA synthetase [Burkholderiales bacterium]